MKYLDKEWFLNEIFRSKEGVYRWPIQGAMFKGMIKHGLPNGSGKNISIFQVNKLGVTLWTNKSTYVGRYVDGKRQGFGRMIYEEGKSEYIGNWHQDRFQGLGIKKD